MAKKSKEEAQQTKRMLIDSAIRVFYEKGYGKTTLTDIADDAGLTRGALYWHFKGKSEIIISIFDEVMAKMNELVFQTIHQEDATIYSVIDFVKRANNLLVSSDDFTIVIRLLLFKTELSGDLEIIEERDKQWVIVHIDRISFLIGNHIKANNLKVNINSREMALSIVAMYRGLALLHTKNREIFPHNDSHIRIVDAFFHNLLNQNNIQQEIDSNEK